MTKRWAINHWNDWCYVKRSIVDVTLFRINVDYLRGHYACADVVLLGFGASLSYYFDPSETKWVEFVPVESLGREHGE